MLSPLFMISVVEANQKYEFGSSLVNCRWLAPEMDFIKINVDGAVFKELHAVGVGMVARNWQGELIAGLLKAIAGYSDAMTAEALALKEGILTAKRLGSSSSKFVLENDAVNVMNSMKGVDSDLSPIWKYC